MELQTPFTCTVRQACALSGLGRTTIFSKISDGSLESTTVGRRRLVNVASLRRLVADCGMDNG